MWALHLMQEAPSRLASKLNEGAKKLTLGYASVTELSQKFCADISAHFVDTQAFYDGLQTFIGTPNPELNEAMKRDHTTQPDSHHWFTTSNYQTHTTSLIEVRCRCEAQTRHRPTPAQAQITAVVGVAQPPRAARDPGVHGMPPVLGRTAARPSPCPRARARARARAWPSA